MLNEGKDDDDDDDDDVVAVAVAVVGCCCLFVCLFVCLLLLLIPQCHRSRGISGPFFWSINPSTFMELCAVFFVGMKHTPNPMVAIYTFHFHHS